MGADTELLGTLADFRFALAGGGSDELRVTAFSGIEGLSELYSFRLELISDEADLDLRDLVGKAGVLSISGEYGDRLVHGIIRRFERIGEGNRWTHYAAEIVPVHWLLTKRVGCRIFLESNCADMSVPGIIRKVLIDAGIPTDRFRFATTRTYPAREYVVQYRESEFDFIARLMEDEGVFFFFEHTADGHVMVIADAPAAHARNPLGDAFVYRSGRGMVAEDEHVFRVRARHEIQFGATRQDDFDFTRPGLDLAAGRSGDSFTSLEFADYPGGFTTKEAAQGYAQLRLEEWQCARQALDLSATARGLLPGFRFSLSEHPAERINGDYLITRIAHQATQSQSAGPEALDGSTTAYEADLRVTPADLPFRPARKTPRPRVQGTQTAIVVGPKDEEIYVDRYGRVKVQFAWDRAGRYDENSSCWIRVSQGWAGGKYGMMFLPRVGHEVVVDFLEGDPDRPIIVGRVYNGDLAPIWDLPDRKWRSGIKSQSYPGGDGASALIFGDAKGEEYVHLHSERDLEITSEATRFDTVGGDHHVHVGQDQAITIKSARSTSIGTDDDAEIGGCMTRQVWGDIGFSAADKFFVGAGQVYIRGNLPVVIESNDGVTLKVGGNFIRVGPEGIDISGGVVNINSGGSADRGSEPEFPKLTDAESADDVSHGYDVSYNADDPHGPPGSDELASGGAQATMTVRTRTSWIELELVDETGQPWPNEDYEVTAPDGTVYRGTLDAKGHARVTIPTPGECQISFPKLDMAAWESA